MEILATQKIGDDLCYFNIYVYNEDNNEVISGQVEVNMEQDVIVNWKHEGYLQKCTAVWKDNKIKEDAFVYIGNVDFDFSNTSLDEDILFYCQNEEEYKKLLNKKDNGEDFYIIDDTFDESMTEKTYNIIKAFVDKNNGIVRFDEGQKRNIPLFYSNFLTDGEPKLDKLFYIGYDEFKDTANEGIIYICGEDTTNKVQPEVEIKDSISEETALLLIKDMTAMLK